MAVVGDLWHNQLCQWLEKDVINQCLELKLEAIHEELLHELASCSWGSPLHDGRITDMHTNTLTYAHTNTHTQTYRHTHTSHKTKKMHKSTLTHTKTLCEINIICFADTCSLLAGKGSVGLWHTDIRLWPVQSPHEVNKPALL